MERLRKLLTTQLAVQPLIWFLGLLTFCLGPGLGILFPQVQTHVQENRNRVGNVDTTLVLTQAMELYWSGIDKIFSQSISSFSSSGSSLDTHEEIKIWINQANHFFRDWFGHDSNHINNREFIESSFPFWSAHRFTLLDDQSPSNIHGSDEFQSHMFRFLQELWDLGIMLIQTDTTITKRQALVKLLDLEQLWRLLSPDPHGVSIQVAVIPAMIAINQSAEARDFIQTGSPLLYSEIRRMFSSFAMEWEQRSFQKLVSQVASTRVQSDYEDPWGFVLLQEANAALQQSTELELEQLNFQLRNPRLSEDDLHWHWLSLLQDRRAAQQFLVRGTPESDQFRGWLEQQVAGFLNIPPNQVQAQIRVERWITNGSTRLPAIDSMQMALGTYRWFFRQGDTPGALETLRVLSYWGIILDWDVVNSLLDEIKNQLDQQTDLFLGLPDHQIREFLKLLDEFHRGNIPDYEDRFTLWFLAHQIIPMILLIEDPIEHLSLFDRFLLGIRVLIQESSRAIISGSSYDKHQAVLRLSVRILDELFDSNFSPIETVHLLFLLTETESLGDLLQILDAALVKVDSISEMVQY